MLADGIGCVVGEVLLTLGAERVLLVHVDESAREIAYDSMVEARAALAHGEAEAVDGVLMDGPMPAFPAPPAPRRVRLSGKVTSQGNGAGGPAPDVSSCNC